MLKPSDISARAGIMRAEIVNAHAVLDSIGDEPGRGITLAERIRRFGRRQQVYQNKILEIRAIITEALGPELIREGASFNEMAEAIMRLREQRDDLIEASRSTQGRDDDR